MKHGGAELDEVTSSPLSTLSLLLCKTGCVMEWEEEKKKKTGLATNGVNAGRQPGVQKTQRENEQKDVR